MTDLIMYKINEPSKEKQVVNLCRKLGLKTRKLKDSDAKITINTLIGNGKINGLQQKSGMSGQDALQQKSEAISHSSSQKNLGQQNHNLMQQNSESQNRNSGNKVPVGYTLPELIVFSGLKDNKLDEFLSEYKKMGIEPISLKAVVTVHNVNWTMHELAEELVKERISAMFGK